MKSIEKLREWANSGKLYDDTKRFVLHFADEIEAEIAESYMELPKDAEGLPIHVGDRITLPRGEETTVQFVAPDCVLPASPVSYYMAVGCRHVKPRTLEDVIYDIAIKSVQVERYIEGVPVLDVDKGQLRDELELHEGEIRELLGADDR